MGKGGSVPKIPTYYASIQFTICQGPIDSLRAIQVEEREVYVGAATDHSTLYLDKPDLFGGPSREGGIQGELDLCFGATDQTPNSHLQSLLGTAIPAFKGVFTAVAKNMLLGNNYYLKPWKFVVRRIHTRKGGIPQWQDSLAEVPVNCLLDSSSVMEISHVGPLVTIKVANIYAFSVGMAVTIQNASDSTYDGTWTISSIDTSAGTFKFSLASTPSGVPDISANSMMTVGYNSLGNMNPAHIIRDCLTDGSFGFGYSETMIDEASFLSAAQLFYDEGLGFSFLWANESSMDDFIAELEKHAQCTVFVDRTTEKYKIFPVRKMESTTGLVLLDDSNIVKVGNFRRKTPNDLISTLTVKYEDYITLKQATYTVHDAALAQRQDGNNTKTVTYNGVTNVGLAQRLALRDARQMAMPVFSCTIECNRDAENLNRGMAFRFHKPDIYPTELIMRVNSIDLGTATNGKITIEAMEDFFHAADIQQIIPPHTHWVSPINDPTAVVYRKLIETPYYMVAKEKGDSYASSLDPLIGFIAVTGVSPTADAYSAGLWSDTGSNYVRRGVADFCYSCTLGVEITRTTTTFVIGNSIDPELLDINSFVIVDNEFMQVTSFSSGSMTVIRGVLDSVPEAHLFGARIFGIQEYSDTDYIEYVDGETVNVKLTTITPKGELALAAANLDSVTIDQRPYRPYPPANVKFNNSYWPGGIVRDGANQFTMSWATRNRLTQTDALVGFYSGNISTEPGVTYSGELRKSSDNSLIDSFSGSTGTSYTFTSVYLGLVYAKVWSVRDGVTSYQTVQHTFTITAASWLTTENSLDVTTENLAIIEF